MGSIDTLLRVRADASQAVRGLAPLQASLTETAADAQVTEKALAELSGQHTISVNDQAIENARKEVERLRGSMREQLRMDPTVDVRDAQKRIAQLQRSIKTLDAQDATVDVAVNADATGLLALKAAVAEAHAGLLTGSGGGLIGGLGTARAGIAGVGGAGAAAAVGIGAAAVGTAAFAAAAWDAGQAAADMQTQVAQLDSLTKGLGEATFANLNEWATKTPFTLDEATDSTKRLVAAGVDLQQLPDYLNDIGNVAAASGVPLNDLASVFAQMESSGKASYENLQQIGDRGIPVWQTLSDKLGIATADLQKMATEGKLGAETIDLLRESLNELYPTGMQTQSEQFNGQMSTLKDTMHNLQVEAGKLFLPTMQDIAATMQDVANATATAVGWVVDLDDAMQGADDSGQGLAETLIGAVPGGGAALRLLTAGHDDAAEATDNHESSADKLAAAIKAELGALEATEQAVQDHTDLMARLDANVADTADHYRELVDNFAAFRGSLIEARSNVYDYQAAVDTLAESLADSATFAPDLEAGRTNWDNLVGLAETASERVEDTWKTRGKGAAVALQASYRQSLHQMLVDAGVESDRAWTLVDQVLKKPHKINLEIGEIDDAELRKRLARLRRERADIEASVTIPKDGFGNTAREAQRELADRLEPVQAKIDAITGKLKGPKDDLDDAANPGGKPRKAKIDAKVDPVSVADANADLDAIIKLRRVAMVDVKFNVPPLPGPVAGGTAGPTAGPTGPAGLRHAGATMMASPAPSATAGAWTPTIGVNGVQGPTTGPQVVRLAPKQTPVAVFLDGVEIAHRIEARRALAATSSVSRTA